MTNEELAARIRQGERELLPELWAAVEKFVAMKAKQRAFQLDSYGGVTDEDLIQCGFLALLDAVETFDPEAGANFISWYAYYLRSAFAQAAGYRTKKRDPLNTADTLDAPMSEDDGRTREDYLESDWAAEDYQDAERRIWLEQLRDTVQKALDDLPAAEREIITGHHLEGLTLKTLAERRGVTLEAIRQRERHGFAKLRRNANKNHLRDFVEEQTPYYLHVGVNRFNATGSSSVETIAIIREDLRERGGWRG